MMNAESHSAESHSAESHSASRHKNRRDPVHALLLGNLLWGVGLGFAFAAGVLALDLGHIRTLAMASPDGIIAVALLSAGSIVTFASVVMGGAIMLIPREGEGGPRSGRRVLQRLVPLRVEARAQARNCARQRQN